MPANNKREKGPSQEERRRKAINQPLVGPPRNPNIQYEGSRNKRSADRRLRTVSSIIAIVLLVALLIPLFSTCIQQNTSSSLFDGPRKVSAAELETNTGVPALLSQAWYVLGRNSPATLAVPPPTAASAIITPSATSVTSSITSGNAGDETTFFANETGHYIKTPFLAYWRNNGKDSVFGYPLSEAFEQNGQQVQLFDQALLVYHPELKGQKGEVQLGFLGQQLAEAQNLVATNPAFGPLAPVSDTANQRYFPESKHSLAYAFKNFWQNNGLLKFLGLPISQEFSSDAITVQYFERGRLEYNPQTQKVDYSNSGDLLLAAKGWPLPAKFNLGLNFNSKIDLGRTLAVRVWSDSGWQPESVQGKFGSNGLKFGQNGPSLKAFEPISPSLQPAPYPLTLSFNDQTGRLRQWSQVITVTYRDFGTQDLTLPPDQLYLADHKADDYDDAMLSAVYKAWSPQPLWTGAWQYPLKLDWTLTTDFAQRRTINGKPDTLYYHGGLDMAPNTGAEGGAIYAPAAGKVVYIGALQARGTTVALDHGLGVTSYYFHLSKSSVHIGQAVQPGDLLGTVGTTGRATGPHLHWEVRVNGIITDPRTFIEQDLSK